MNETIAFILALAAFAAGFAVRPLGALVFGRIGDLVGRKTTFLVTMGIMGLSTCAVGLLPTYAAVGAAAPVLLVLLRLLQGLALGGQYGGARPTSPSMRRTEWAWRVPFLASILLLLVTLWVRFQLNESPVYQQMKAEGSTSKAPLRESFAQWSNLKLVLAALFGAVAGGTSIRGFGIRSSSRR